MRAWHRLPVDGLKWMGEIGHHGQATTIPAWAADEPRQYARARRAVARGVVLRVPPRGAARRRLLRSRRDGAELRAAHGVHLLRDHRRPRAAKLARASRATEPDGHAMANVR